MLHLTDVVMQRSAAGKGAMACTTTEPVVVCVGLHGVLVCILASVV